MIINNKHYGEGSYNMVDKDGKKYLLTVEQDEDAENPREWDSIAEIYCWHRYYKIGDHKIQGMSFSDALIELCEKHADFGEDELYELNNTTMISALEESNTIAFKIINCYEHSGITIYTSNAYPYNDRWDAGCIGFAFVEKEMAMKYIVEPILDENGEQIKVEHKHEGLPSTWSYETKPLTDETWKNAAYKHIDEEVKILDHWLQNECYSFTLEEEAHYRNEEHCPHCGEVTKVDEYDTWEEVDSRCGFYGDCLEENGIVDNLPNGLQFVD